MDPTTRPIDVRGRFDLVLVVDGEPPRPGWRSLVAPEATVVAADGGALHALAEDVPLDDVVGDLDSLDSAVLATLDRGGTRIHRFPRDKNFTDFELAARMVHERYVASTPDVLVVGGAGGRFDHLLGNLSVLSGSHLAPFALTALMGEALLRIATPDRPVRIDSSVGRVVSLLPLDDDAHGVVTEGMRFELDDEDLYATQTRGISNVVARSPATVRLGHGRLLVLQPDGVDDLIQRHRTGEP